MSAAATLKAALAQNGITLDQLVAMREREARRLPWVGPKVWAEAKRQASKRGDDRHSQHDDLPSNPSRHGYGRWPLHPHG